MSRILSHKRLTLAGRTATLAATLSLGACAQVGRSWPWHGGSKEPEASVADAAPTAEIRTRESDRLLGRTGRQEPARRQGDAQLCPQPEGSRRASRRRLARCRAPTCSTAITRITCPNTAALLSIRPGQPRGPVARAGRRSGQARLARDFRARHGHGQAGRATRRPSRSSSVPASLAPNQASVHEQSRHGLHHGRPG